MLLLVISYGLGVVFGQEPNIVKFFVRPKKGQLLFIVFEFRWV